MNFRVISKLMLLLANVAVVSCGDYAGVSPSGADMRPFEWEKLVYMATLHYACYGNARYIEGGSGSLTEEHHLQNARFLLEFAKNSTISGKPIPEKTVNGLNEYEEGLLKAYREDAMDELAKGKEIDPDLLFKDLASSSKFSSLQGLKRCSELSRATRLVVDQHIN